MSPERNADRDRADWEDAAGREETFSLLHYLSVLLKKRWLIIGGTLAFCALALVYSKLQTPVFQAATSFTPSRAQNMSQRLDQSFGMGRGAMDPYYENQYLVEFYTKLLNGVEFLARVANRPFQVGSEAKPITLIEYYKQPGATEQERLYKTVDRIMANLQVISPRQVLSRTTPMVITIVYSSSNPQMAAAIANMILDELVVFNQTAQSASTQANRRFFEEQLEQARKDLAEAERARVSFEQSNRKLATPDLKLQADRLKRAADQQANVFDTLNRQLELAKIQEQENRTFVDILQRAVPPRSRTSPNVRKNVLLGGMLGLILFCSLALGSDVMKRISVKDESSRELLETLQNVKGDVSKVGRWLGFGKKKNGTRIR